MTATDLVDARAGTALPARAPALSLRTLARLAGPGVVVAIAYVDPGNFATNMTAGASLGTTLLWVVVGAGVCAMLVQYLAASLGAATGRSLPELCRERYHPVANGFLWLQAEAVAIATDIAEVVGGAIALALLFGVPLPLGGLVVGLAGVGLLLLRPGGRLGFQAVIGLLLAGIVGCLLFQALRLQVFGLQAVEGLRPSLAGTGAVVLATGIVGATVMPHAVYLHSALTRDLHRRPDGGRLRGQRREITIALTVAAVANAAILLVAASALHGPGMPVIDSLELAHAGLGQVSAVVAGAFAFALLISGLAASGVGTMAGDVIMSGFLGRRIPLVLRRLVTTGPALVLLMLPVGPTDALVLSQVVLSFGVPFALIPLIHLSARRDVMGAHRARRSTTVAAAGITAVICVLNAAGLVSLLGG